MSCEIILFILVITALSLIILMFIKWLIKKYLVDFCITEMSGSTLNDHKKRSDSEEFKMKISGFINGLFFLICLFIAIMVLDRLIGIGIEINNLIYLLGLYFSFIGSLIFVLFGSFEPATYYKRFLRSGTSGEVQIVLRSAKERYIFIFTGLFIFILGFLMILTNTIVSL